MRWAGALANRTAGYYFLSRVDEPLDLLSVALNAINRLHRVVLLALQYSAEATLPGKAVLRELLQAEYNSFKVRTGLVSPAAGASTTPSTTPSCGPWNCTYGLHAPRIPAVSCL